MKRKMVAMILSVALLMTACGNTAGSGTQNTDATATETVAPADDTQQSDTGSDADTTADASADTAADTAADATDAAAETGIEIPDVSIKVANSHPDSDTIAFEQEMKIIWNMGNTLDAFSDQKMSNHLDTETYWQHVKVTEETIKNIHAGGFETIRIPISWHNHLDEDYTIKTDWMDRVQEIVDYAINDGMHVIINIHHDNEEQLGCFYPDSAHYDRSEHFITRIWEQVAERFADYDEKLIFESMNEPRLTGTNYEWWLDPTSDQCLDAVDCINRLNQTFVNVVRASGGNNATRYLLCPGYCASPDGAMNEHFKLPEDPANHVMVEVHAYTPYAFALEDGSDNTFDSSNPYDTAEISDLMTHLYSAFIKQGIAVVVDEFGARDKNNLQDRVDYATYYIAAGRARCITCGWWDNGNFSGSGEIFPIYNRAQETWEYPEILEGLMKYAE